MQAYDLRVMQSFSQGYSSMFIYRAPTQKNPAGPTPQAQNPISCKPQSQEPNPRPQPQKPNPRTTINEQK